MEQYFATPMSYDFLSGYTIPTLQQPPPPPTALLSYFEEQSGEQPTPSPTSTNHTQPPSNERFIPPGLRGTNYRTPASRPFKRKYSSGPGTAKPAPVVEITPDGRLAIFKGRDVSYPDELNKLIHPLHCDLCNTQMNSTHSAKDHYESKAHDRNLTAWLTKNYTEKGLQPPAVKRFIKEGPSGPNAFHCELCDLKLTSLTHANQHYSGRKHRLVASKISQPSGAGYYDADGKWIRTGTKFIAPSTDKRFGIGELSKEQSKVAAAEMQAADTTTPTEGEITAATSAKSESVTTVGLVAQPQNLSLYCQVCKVSVTSHSQMTMHLNGIKHQKKLKQHGLDPAVSGPSTVSESVTMEQAAIAESNTSGVSILESINEQVNPSEDFSMFRTPTGSYYCKTCNMSMCHVKALQQHLIGKKHLKKSNDEKEKAKADAVATVKQAVRK